MKIKMIRIELLRGLGENKLELEKTPWSPYGVNAQGTAHKSTPKSISGQEKEHETGKERSF